MQAAKRYGLVAILSILLTLGYFYLPRPSVSVGGKFSSSPHLTTSRGNSETSPSRSDDPRRGETPSSKKLQKSPLKEEKTELKTNETNLQIPEDEHSEQKTPQSQKPLSTNQNPALDQNEKKEDEKKEGDQPSPVDSVKETEHDTSAEEQTQRGGSEQAVPQSKAVSQTPHETTEVMPHLKQLMSETGLKLNQLDELYNVSRVSHHLDLGNITFLDQYYRYNFQVIEDRLSNRMKNVQSVCEQIHFKKSSHYNLYRFNELGVTWCPVFKSGSTTWRNYFIDKFVSDPPENYVLNLLKPRQLLGSKKTRIEDMKQYYRDEDERNIRFTMVRHPFSRLVSHVKSSGRDHEMVNQRGLWIESAIIAGRSHLAANNGELLRFKAEFGNYFHWLKYGKPGGVFKDGSPNNPFLNPPVPSLSELVNHIIKMRRSGRDWDGHWMPAHEFCNICVNQFQYIIKLEEEPLELWYLVDKLGLWEDRALFLNRANNSTKRETEMGEVWEEIKKLKKEQVDFLSRHFDVDFRMYGYRRGHEG